MEKNKELIVNRIEPFMERFKKYFQLGHITFSDKELKEVAELNKMISNKTNLNFRLNCSSCVKDAIILLSNYYDLYKVKEIKEIIEVKEDKLEEKPKKGKSKKEVKEKKD